METKLLENAIDLDMEEMESLVRLGECVTVCYNQATVWQSRGMAAEFYLEAMTMCEGAERDRYTEVLLDIMAGMPVCHDGVTRMITWETEYR